MYLRYESKNNDVLAFGSKLFTVRYYSLSYREDGLRVDTLRFIQRFPSWKQAVEKANEIISGFNEVKEDL